MIKHLPAVLLAASFGFSGTNWISAAALDLVGPDLFQQSVTSNLRLANDGIELEWGELFEDDGPASGHSYQQPANREALNNGTWIKKELIIPTPAAQAAFLVILADGPVEALINGLPLKLEGNLSGRSSYRAYSFDPGILQPGLNQVVLHGSGSVMLARDDEYRLGSRTRTRHPNRSAKSNDAGKSWDYDHLGPDGKLDGEYGVRIFLEHYRPFGSLVTPVVDLGNLSKKPVGLPLTNIGPCRITVTSERGAAGSILVKARSGDTYVPGEEHWSSWQILGENGGTVAQPRGRYLQLTLELATSAPLSSPTIKGVRLEATPEPTADWTSGLSILDAHNEAIVRTSIPFQYEPLDHPHLRTLREQYHLDEVVKGATGELELMLRLAQWACNYWDWPNHITEYYPRWDALDILKPYKDGKPTGGFCQQFNLVFLQACESFGFNGRAISISQGRCQQRFPAGGHEIVELWSNEWKKWVYVDGALAWYIVDPKTAVPLSIWELRQRQLPTVRGEPVSDVRVVAAERTKNRQFGWKGIAAPEPTNWYLELRMIPRSNFLQEMSPLPLNQGTEEWAWTGHYVWTDGEVPAGLLFGNRVSRRSDFEWTLNQAHYILEPSETPGNFRVHLDTETPSFETFLAQIDGATKQRVVSGFSWKLHPGKNELRVWPRNIAGREGIASWVSFEYTGTLNKNSAVTN